MIEVATIVSQPFSENTYLVWVTGQTECVVVDPGFEPYLIDETLADRGLIPVAIVNTHGHCDHIAGNQNLKEAYPHAPLIIGAGDAEMLTNAQLNLSESFGMPFVSPPADRLVREGEVLELAGMKWQVFEVPGHSPGHVVYQLIGTQPILIGGDVLFRGGIGRTDFPGGSFETLLAGIRSKLWAMPPETVVYPGHGPTTTIARERRTNPFCGDDAQMA